MLNRKTRSTPSRWLVCLGLGLTWLVSGSAIAAEPSAISWRADLRSAQAEARAQGRPIWLQFTGPWCPSCERMERDTFRQSRIVARARSRFIPVRLRSDVHEELVSRYGITGIPTTIIVQPNGQVIARNEGFLDGPAFASFLDSALAADLRGRSIAATRPRPAPPAALQKIETDLSLAGFCPVSLVDDHRLVAGQPNVSLEYDGHVYRFANPFVRQVFQRQPQKFVPINTGHCPVAEVDQGESRRGNPRFGALYQGHLYLFADEPSRARFLQTPERYSRVDIADRELCPHCRVSRELLPRGQSATLLTRESYPPFFPALSRAEMTRSPSGITRR